MFTRFVHLPGFDARRFLYSKTCSGDQSDKVTACPRRPCTAARTKGCNFQSNGMELDKETTWLQRPHFEGPLSGRHTQVSLYIVHFVNFLLHPVLFFPCTVQ